LEGNASQGYGPTGCFFLVATLQCGKNASGSLQEENEHYDFLLVFAKNPVISFLTLSL